MAIAALITRVGKLLLVMRDRLGFVGSVLARKEFWVT